MARASRNPYLTEYKKRRYSVRELYRGTWLSGDRYNDLQQAIDAAKECEGKAKVIDTFTKEIVFVKEESK